MQFKQALRNLGLPLPTLFAMGPVQIQDGECDESAEGA